MLNLQIEAATLFNLSILVDTLQIRFINWKLLPILYAHIYVENIFAIQIY